MTTGYVRTSRSVVADVSLRGYGERWMAVAQISGEPEVGFGHTAHQALEASLSSLDSRAAEALMADPQLLAAAAFRCSRSRRFDTHRSPPRPLDSGGTGGYRQWATQEEAMPVAQRSAVEIEREERGESRWSFARAVAVLERFVRHDEVSQAEAERAVDYLGHRFMKVGDAQKILGVKSPTTIKKWIGQGAFPGAHQQGTHWMLPADRVYAFRDASLRADRMNANRRIEQEVYEGDDLFAELGL